MKLRTTNDLLATDKGSLIIYCQDLHIEIERMRTDSTRYWRNRVEQAAAAEREACADLAQGWNTAMTDKLAAEIRARGAKGCEKC